MGREGESWKTPVRLGWKGGRKTWRSCGEEKERWEMMGRRDVGKMRSWRPVDLGSLGHSLRRTLEAVWPGKAGTGPRAFSNPRPTHTSLFSPQIKVEEDFGFETDEALDSGWVSRGPDKLLPYPTLASPPFD